MTTSARRPRRDNFLGFGKQTTYSSRLSKEAYEAGRRSGDTDEFYNWISGQENISRSLKARLQKRYRAGVMSLWNEETRSKKAEARESKRAAAAESKEVVRDAAAALKDQGIANATGRARSAYKKGDSAIDVVNRVLGSRFNPTDRAHRYRANVVAESGELGPRRCHFCGATRVPMLVAHIDGHEENGEIQNLAWTCRSCNALTSEVVNRAGIGRRTHQYNPKKRSSGISFGQYTTAVQVLRGESSDISVDDAVEVVRSTPAYRRSSYARDVWRLRKERYGPSGRKNPGRRGEFARCVDKVAARGGVDDPAAVCASSFRKAYGPKYLKRRRSKNPVDAAAKAFERFQGRPATGELVFESTEHEHTVFGDAGELIELVIVPAGKTYGIRLHGFKGARLAFNENWKVPQLFVVGGDQSVDLEQFGIRHAHEFEVLGQIVQVTYYTNKAHLGRDGGEADYFHKFGEETARGKKKTFRFRASPTGNYDTVNKLISFSGGTYTITPEGIRD